MSSENTIKLLTEACASLGMMNEVPGSNGSLLSMDESERDLISSKLDLAIKAIGEEESGVMGALHSPTNQPSQFGVVPENYLVLAELLIDGLVSQFSSVGCTCVAGSDKCCFYSEASNYLKKLRVTT